ncbi:MAG: hypothetical protein KY475_00010 [Planctomycetes bacterium]|nr:hypothetical protein [Planctomycetota bacterium]
MRSFPLILFGIAMTVLSWGLYGNVLHKGQHDLQGRLKPLICVGLAYFIIAIIVPTAALAAQGKLRGQWTMSGIFWSMAGGAAGALGALGLILALASGGHPIYVMPLVFGGAPVVNTLVAVSVGRMWRHLNPVFVSGLILVIVGAVAVLVFQPGSGPQAASGPPLSQIPLILGGVGLTVLCWGAYGNVLHKGQHDLGGSRLKPLICVGFAYFFIAILAPTALLAAQGALTEAWTVSGIGWSMGGGAAGAFGALGVILAMSSGGRPIYVMPLVFGGAPVVNTLTAMYVKGTLSDISPMFFAGLILVAVGAVVVLVFQPRPAKKPGKPGPQKPALAAEGKPAKEPAT